MQLDKGTGRKKAMVGTYSQEEIACLAYQSPSHNQPYLQPFSVFFIHFVNAFVITSPAFPLNAVKHNATISTFP